MTNEKISPKTITQLEQLNASLNMALMVNNQQMLEIIKRDVKKIHDANKGIKGTTYSTFRKACVEMLDKINAAGSNLPVQQQIG
jgi:hypothetical protein